MFVRASTHVSHSDTLMAFALRRLDTRLGGPAQLGGSRRPGWEVLGFGLRHHERPRPLGRCIAQPVEADTAAGVVVSWRQFAPVASLFSVSGLADQGATGRTSYPC